jgi:hypothetical protein
MTHANRSCSPHLRGRATLGALKSLACLTLFAALATGCATARHADVIDKALASTPLLKSVSEHAPDYRLQIAIARVDQAPTGPTLTRWTYRCGEEYFYPASCVKLFGVIAALERLHELQESTGNSLLSADTPMRIGPLFEGDPVQDRDPTNITDGTITIQHELRKIFLVSDNDAFNRLVDFVGFDDLNARMHRAGLSSVAITHRLSESRRVPNPASSAPITFVTPRGDIKLEPVVSVGHPSNAGQKRLQVGTGYMRGKELVKTPMDFTTRNGVSLTDLQNALIMTVRPDIDIGLPGFKLDEGDRRRIIGVMAEYPHQSSNPVYAGPDFPDEFCKFGLPGLLNWRPQSRLQILDKIGQAYGFTIDNACVTDVQTGATFFIAAAIYTNADGILNDDVYEYTSIAEPFMAELALAIAKQLDSSAAGDSGTASSKAP